MCMAIKLSQRINRLRPSATFGMDLLVMKMKKEGEEVINLALGEPDFETPRTIKNGGIRAIKDGFTHYSAVSGIYELKQKIRKKFKYKDNISYDFEEIAVGIGSKQILFNTFMALCGRGDEVVIPTPAWSSYIEQIKLTGAKPVLVPLKFPFKAKASDFVSAVTKKTKVFVINTPCNPTGAVIERHELLKIARIAQKKNIFVISDEIYERFSYKNKHYSIASFGKDIKERTITINGLSKSHAMTGWRIGYCGGPAYVIKRIVDLQGQTASGAPSISQKAAVLAFTKEAEKEVRGMMREFAKRRTYLAAELSKIKNLSFAIPEGAFYFFIDVTSCLSKSLPSSNVWCERLLSEKKVALVPGEAFEHPGFVRLSFTRDISILKVAAERIRDFINEH